MPIYVGSNEIVSAAIGVAPLVSVAAPSITSPGTFVSVPVSSGPTPELDPLFADVAMLLSFENENGNGSLVDLSPTNTPVQVVSGSPEISTAFSKTGASSLKLPLNSAQVSATVQEYLGPLTIEFWMRPSSAGSGWVAPSRPGSQDDPGTQSVLIAAHTPSSSLLFLEVTPSYARFIRSQFGFPGAYSAGGIAADVWTHVAVVRNATQAQVFINGVGGTVASVPGTAPVNVPCNLLANQVGGGLYLDDYRVTKAVRYPLGQNFTPPAAMVVTLAPSLPASRTIYTGETTLTPTVRRTAGVSVVSYQWQKSESGSSTFSAISGATSASLTLQNLTNAADTGDRYRVMVTLSDGQSAASNACTLTVDESGINTDNRFRVTAAASTTSLTASVDSTTGYWKMIASSGQASPVIGSQWSQWSPYYYLTGTISGMPSGSEKTVEVFSCDANGNPSGELEFVTFAPSSQGIVAVDASGCASMRGFNVSSSASPYVGFMNSPSQMPATLVSVRAVGMAGNGGSYSQWGSGPPVTSGGINVAGQNLSAAALDQLYTDLGNGTNNARLFVAGNPGTAADTPSIATAKGYTVFAGPEPVAPNAPTSLTATASNAQIALAWTAPSAPGTSAITGYVVEYTPSGGSAATVNTNSTATSYTLTGLTNGTSYTVRVAAISAIGTGTYSATATGTPSAGPTVTHNSGGTNVSGAGTTASPLRITSPYGVSGVNIYFTTNVTGTMTIVYTATFSGGEQVQASVYRGSTEVSGWGGSRTITLSVSAGQQYRLWIDSTFGGDTCVISVA